ncbi:MAG: TolC family protein [Balneolaceae bacterium]
MMQKILLISFLLFVPFLSYGQTTVTLEEAIQLALENNYQLKQSLNNLDLAEYQTQSAKADFLPSLSANFNGARGVGRQFIEEELAFEDRTTYRLNGGLNASIDIFSGFRNIANLRATEANELSQEEFYQRLRETITFDTASRYLNVMVNQELLRIAESNLEASSSQLEQIEAQVEVGSRPTVDLYNQEAIVANDELAVIQQQNALSVSKAQLIRIMQEETIEDVEVSMEEVDEANLFPSEYSLNEMLEVALQNRSDIRAQEYEIEVNRQDIRIARANSLPSLSASAGISSAYFRDASSLNVPFSDQFFDQRISRSFGINLSIPIFNNLNNRTNLQSSQIQLRNSQLELQNIRFQVSEEVRQAYNDYQSLVQELESTEKALIAAERAFETEQQRYEVGSTTLIELNQANANFVSAQSERVQTIYNFIFQEKLLDYFIGQLDESIQLN